MYHEADRLAPDLECDNTGLIAPAVGHLRCELELLHVTGDSLLGHVPHAHVNRRRCILHNGLDERHIDRLVTALVGAERAQLR